MASVSTLTEATRRYGLGAPQGAERRVFAIEFPDEAHLHRFLEARAPAIEAELEQAFGEQLDVERRTLKGRPQEDSGFTADVERCMNCDAVLTGQYCGDCGQRGQSRLISLFELVRDAFGDLFEFDSRIWRTLIPLAIRPGRLTLDYLNGRRARYMPPFRMYLVLSLAFFVIAFFDPQRSLGILFADDSGEAAETVPADVEDTSETAAVGEEPDDAVDGPVRIDFGDGERDFRDCEIEGYDASDMPDWLARRFTKARLQAACRNIVGEDGAGWQSVLDGIVENVPAGLFVLLPFMALVLKLLYPFSRRYYVEHLLFVIHYHSFVFLLLTLGVLFGRLLALLGLPAAMGEFASVAGSIYIVVYLYRSLRRVYGQGHLLTLPKFFALVVIYSLGLGLMLFVAGVLAAFSV